MLQIWSKNCFLLRGSKNVILYIENKGFDKDLTKWMVLAGTVCNSTTVTYWLLQYCTTDKLISILPISTVEGGEGGKIGPPSPTKFFFF